MKRSIVVWLLVLVASACAGDAGTTTSSADPGDTTATFESTTTLGAGDSTTTSGETTTTSDRQLAPDFTLELGDGGSYTLSEGARPVYLVFWAEW